MRWKPSKEAPGYKPNLLTTWWIRPASPRANCGSNFVPTNVYEIVRATYHSQKPSAELRNITFELASDSEEIAVFGDSGRLQQVFNNLISNAIKFTPEGGSVNVKVETGKDAVRVTVKDTGRGISADILPTIFRQFSQGEDAMHDRGSLGLGLSIVKILVGKHGGTVRAESEGVDLERYLR